MPISGPQASSREVPTTCIRGELPDPVTPGVWWRDDTVWCRYEKQHAELIKKAFNKGRKSVDLEGVINWYAPTYGEAYTVDLRIMQQRSPRGFLRPVLIVDAAAAVQGGPKTVQVSNQISCKEYLARGGRHSVLKFKWRPCTLIDLVNVYFFIG